MGDVLLRSPGDESIAARVRRYAQETPDAVFCTLVAGGTSTTLTFAEFFAAGCRHAHALRERGVGSGDVVPIMLRHGRALLESFLGVLLAGAVPSYMPFPSVKQRGNVFWRDHDALFDRLLPRLIITYAENAEAATVLSRPIDILVVDDAGPAGISSDDGLPGCDAAADDVACLQHSSGTTGLKKGVMLTHRAIMEQVEAYAATLGFVQGDRIVSWLPLYHDMGFIACFMMSMIQGSHLIALDPFEWVMRPASLFEAIERYRGTFAWLPNFAFAHLARSVHPGRTFELGSIRALIDCSEPCRPATLERFADRFGPYGIDDTKLQVCYAMAENVFAVTQTPMGRRPRVLDVDAEALALHRVEKPLAAERSRALISCGRPIAGVRIRICAASGEDAPLGTVGEITISSPFLFDGYYRRPDVTAQRLRNGWYATGDLGFLDGEDLFVTGRVDDMIIVNGRNFYAHEIESFVSDIPGVIPGRCSAIEIDDVDADATRVVILAECREPHSDGRKTARAIREGVQDRLGVAVHAVTLLPAGALEKTTSGKMSRVKNKERYVSGEFLRIAAGA
jgi:fatty-acyl-CoA synthase